MTEFAYYNWVHASIQMLQFKAIFSEHPYSEKLEAKNLNPKYGPCTQFNVSVHEWAHLLCIRNYYLVCNKATCLAMPCLRVSAASKFLNMRFSVGRDLLLSRA